MKQYKCRKTEWFDIETAMIRYGIKVLSDGKWIDAGDNNGLFLFCSKAKRDKKIKELEK